MHKIKIMAINHCVQNLNVEPAIEELKSDDEEEDEDELAHNHARKVE